MKKISRDLQ